MAARRRSRGSRIRRWSMRALVALTIAAAAGYLFCACTLLGLRWIDPPTTMVQLQRRIESWGGEAPYTKRYRFVELDEIDPELRRAVVAAEDSRFFRHDGIDWDAVGDALEERAGGGRARGASTITQQLVKNLFLTTHRSMFRKLAEVPLAYTAEVLLPKERILELYLNVVEWGDGVYGAEAAARYHYATGADRLGRERASRLAACLPDPRRRRPQRMDRYSEIIRRRMAVLDR